MLAGAWRVWERSGMPLSYPLGFCLSSSLPPSSSPLLGRFSLFCWTHFIHSSPHQVPFLTPPSLLLSLCLLPLNSIALPLPSHLQSTSVSLIFLLLLLSLPSDALLPSRRISNLSPPLSSFLSYFSTSLSCGSIAGPPPLSQLSLSAVPPCTVAALPNPTELVRPRNDTLAKLPLLAVT